MKNSREGLNSPTEQTEELVKLRLSNPRHKKPGRLRNSPRDLWDSLKRNNIQIMGVQEGEKRKRNRICRNNSPKGPKFDEK